MVVWDSGVASLTFLDDAWSEYRASDGTRRGTPREEVRIKIAHGEPIPHPVEQCMEKARAFVAMREFLTQGKRPDWLTYKYIR
jgi:hypothetical protein